MTADGSSAPAAAAAPPAEAVARLGTPRLAVVGVPILVLAGISIAEFGLGARGVLAAALCAVLVWLSAIDVAERRLPNAIVLPAAAVMLVAQIALSPDRAFEWTVAAVGAAIALLLPLVLFPAGIGMGDVKLALLMGASLGSAVIGALFIASIAAAVVGLALIAIHGTAARKQSIPFGPFLAIGTVVMLLLGGGWS